MSKIKQFINILKAKYQNKDNKDLANNTIALTILNFFNFVLPLFTIPVLLNNLGAAAYGIVNIYISLYAIFQKVVDYGFNYIGTRKLSMTDNDNEKNIIFTEILACKLINAIVIILGSALYFILTKTDNIVVAHIISSELIGTALSMYWLFQGLKKMQVITWITSVTKIIYSLLIILLIKDSGDMLLYAILYSFISIAIGLSGLFVAFGNSFRLRIVRIKVSNLVESYKEGWHMFVASLCGGLTTNLSTVVLGALKGEVSVAYFSAGYKIVQALSLVFSAITQALYPFSCEKFKNSFYDGRRFVYKVMRLVLLFIGTACFLLSIISPFLFRWIFDTIYWPYYPIAIIGSVWLFFSFLNNFLGLQILVAGGYSSNYRKLFTIATVLTIAGYYLLIPYISIYGSILSLLLGEVILAFLLKKDINKIIRYTEV
jgi:PST family polysaccharide transporter